ncbi:FMN-dependent NADH-azoreductase [Secundilactobacillus malefermentans]|uniref:FMN-dependent NADH-azoreductase n=1 Tax=Secundilactobacillus malefermentans TaxID=176292 RepID=UPI0011CC2007|nr:NAD(P)H-dependent oxidoreductase [Secundilactobacillus malefermentans]QEA31098.1 FMN-dependent NADH-azoreductase [Secundilactobacillus malefermentans]
MQTLLINAHPDFANQDHFSNQLEEQFLTKYQQLFPNEQPTVLNLYDSEIPRIEKGQLLDVWNKQRSGEKMTADEDHVAQVSNNLLTQFKAHHRIVIVSPLHNFNVTSRMKDYIDNILIAQQTFKYTETGSVGLMTDDYRVMLLQASGSIYTNNDRYTPLEFSHFYLREMFVEMMGFDQFNIVRAQGTSIRSPEEVWQSVPEELDQAMHDFYAKK